MLIGKEENMLDQIYRSTTTSEKRGVLISDLPCGKERKGGKKRPD